MSITKLSCLAALFPASWATPSLGQVFYFDVTWSGSGASASARVAIDTSVTLATDNTLHSITSGISTTWIQFSDFQISAGGNTIAPSQDDLTSISWRSSSPINPSQFFFDADDAPQGSVAWQISGSSPNTLQLTLNPSSSPTTYTMTQQTFSAVPEPEEWAAIASSGLLAFALWHRRSRMTAKA